MFHSLTLFSHLQLKALWLYRGLCCGVDPSQHKYQHRPKNPIHLDWQTHKQKKKEAYRNICLSCCLQSCQLERMYMHMCVYMQVCAEIHASEKKQTLFVPVKVLVQCRSSFYEWLIKEETVVFSANGGWW